MRFRPVTQAVLVTELADLLATRPPDAWVRVIIDGAPPSAPGELAERLAAELRVLGRAVLQVSAADFLRPASLRYERGREDPDSRYEDWLDAGGLAREVLDPLKPGGTGRVLPSLWNTETDRATRASYVSLPPGGIVIVSGELLLGRAFGYEHSVHLWMSAPALARRMPAEEAWALPAFARYDRQVRPLHTADTGVTMDDPARPAVLDDGPV